MEQLCQEGGLVNCLVFGFPREGAVYSSPHAS